MQTPLPSSLGWYAVHTKPRQEHRALLNLQQQGYTCFSPTFSVQKLQRGKLITQVEPLFSRYLFIELDSGNAGKSWAPIRSTLGVSRLVSFGPEPAKIATELVATLRQQNEARQCQPQLLFQSGDTVQITHGPFAGLSAIYQMDDGEARAMVLIEMMSQSCRLAVPAAHLLKVA